MNNYKIFQTATVILTAALLLLGSSNSSSADSGDTIADRVLGQSGFNSNSQGTGLTGLARPTAITIDSSVSPNRIYVADFGNNRVLGWKDANSFSNGAAADIVIGHCASPATKTTLCQPTGVAVDGEGNLYIADNGENRVVEFDSPFTTDTVADRVFGKLDFTSSNLCATTPSANSLCEPSAVVMDGAGRLYVADTSDSRVLEYDTPLSSSTANHVIGQSDFSSFFCNQLLLGISASSLCHPTDVALDSTNRLYVVDSGNNRVLAYDAPLSGPTANQVFGQTDFVSSSCNNGGITASSLCFEINTLRTGGAAVDIDGNLYISDSANNRVLEYDSPSTSDEIADSVFGQNGSFTTAVCGNGVFGTLDANSLCTPLGLATDSGGNLYAADSENNRVLEYDAPVVTPGPIIPTSGNVGPPSNVNAQGTIAEPVSTGNGNYYYIHTDFAIPERGLPLLFKRSYNTLDPYLGPLGANWTHNYNIVLMADSGGAVIKWGDGHGESFTLSGSNFVAQPGVFSKLFKNTDGTFALIQKNRTTYNFSASGKLASVVDRNGNQISLAYDASANLIAITGPGGRSLSLAYDSNKRITQITDPAGRSVSFSYDTSGNLVQAVDAAGGVTAYAYDSSHRVTSVTLPNGNVLLQNSYDGQGRVASQSNGRGFTWQFAYNAPGAGETTITDPRGNSTVHRYDSSLRIVKIADALGGTVSYAYDSNNNRTAVTNQNGKTTAFTYDPDGNVTGITDPLGNESVFTYDANNDLLSATNPRGNTTAFSYDGQGNLIGIQDALGENTVFSYDTFGQLVSKRDARGETTTFTYNPFGDLKRISDALGDTTRLGYDVVGRLTSVTDANGHAATSAYDLLNRLTSIVDPLGDTTTFNYDPIGQLTKLTDANKHVTQYDYDLVGNLISVTDALGHVTNYGHDAGNNRASFTNADGVVTSYTFDALNRLTHTTDPLGFIISYIYDGMGNVTATANPNGHTTQFTYDALNRLIGIAYADSSNVAYTYDVDGNRTTMTDSHGSTAYSYDPLDRLTAVASPEGTVAYSYNKVGDRRSITYPDGKVVTYTYDPANLLADVIDWRGWTTQYIYDPAGNLRHVFYPSSGTVSFLYDSANRLINVHNRYIGPVSPILNFAYTLDPVGNRIKVVNGIGVTTSYVYDALNRLVKVKKNGQATSVTYDAVGNRIAMTGPTGPIVYSYDVDDRLLSAGSSTFTYDANGNRVTETTPTGMEAYTYDDANRLIIASGGGANSVFSYDGDGNRVARNGHAYINDVAGALTQVLQEDQGSGLASYVRGLSLISESVDGFNRFYQYDGLGSVVGLTNIADALKERYNYDAWGNPAPIPLDAIGTRNPFRFAGEALDPGSGFYYLRARYYDPSAARFLTKDTFYAIPRDPRTLNFYVYGLNRPTILVDPSGHFVWFLPGLAGAIINDGFYGYDVLTHKSEFSFSTLAGRTVGGFVAPYAYTACLAGTPIAGGACAGAAEYFADWLTQKGVSYTDVLITGQHYADVSTESFSVAQLAEQTAIGGAMGPLSDSLIKTVLGSNVGRNPTLLMTLLLGRESQKQTLSELLDQLLERSAELLADPSQALASDKQGK